MHHGEIKGGERKEGVVDGKNRIEDKGVQVQYGRIPTNK